MKLLQINSVLNSGSTGRIAEDIGLAVIKSGGQSIIAAGYTHRPSQSEVLSIGSTWDRKLHGLKTRLFDLHGFGSTAATKALVREIKNIQPDIIHLHNIHGYYLNVEVLFDYLKTKNIPIVWTLHDCWSFTGHCSFFDRYNCMKWETECNHCPNSKGYPESWIVDNSRNNFYRKKEIFNGVKNLTIVTPSEWLANHVKHSFLSHYPARMIHNGIDMDVFKPVEKSDCLDKYNFKGSKFVLGVASIWDRRKGLDDFIELRKWLSTDVQIALVGLTKEQIKNLPVGVIGIERTENVAELVALYSEATVFVNPTFVDNFPTTNIEALACGTPVITYRTGGSPEAIDEKTGMVVEKGDVEELAKAIRQVIEKGKAYYSPLCRERAMKLFNKIERYEDYMKLYEEVIQRKNVTLSSTESETV